MPKSGLWMTVLLTLVTQGLLAQEPLLIQRTWGHRIYEVKADLAAGAKINETDSAGWTALMWAVQSEDLLFADYLLRAGADPNTQSTIEQRRFPKGTTALMIASSMGLPDLVKALIDAGAQRDLKDARGMTALMLASKQENTEIMSLFGIKTPQDPEMVKAIREVEQGSDVNAADKDGLTPLMKAAYFGDLDALNFFLDKGAALNAQSSKALGNLPPGVTPIIIASYYGAENIVKCLLQRGADPNLKDAKNRTALSYAKEYGFNGVCELLGAAPAEPLLDGYYPDLAITVFTSEPTVTKHYRDVVEECGERLLAAINYGKHFKVVPLPAAGENQPSPCLLIKADLNDIHVASGVARFLVGPLAGRSHIQVKLQLIDARSNRVLKEKLLDSQNSSMISSLSLGRSDNSLPGDAANLILDYVNQVNRPEKRYAAPAKAPVTATAAP